MSRVAAVDVVEVCLHLQAAQTGVADVLHVKSKRT